MTDSLTTDSPNIYAYVGNNPLDSSDPLGLRALSDCEKGLLAPYIPKIDLDSADIHDGTVPWYLPKSMDGITRGNNIYFRPGAYPEGTSAGLQILGHELVHVGQYRQGMTWASYFWSVRSGYAEDSKYEKPAYAMGSNILNDLNSSGTDCSCGK